MEKLKRLREERGLSQVKLAARADLNPATVNQIERGMRDASPGTLRKLADALEVSLYELMEAEAPKVEAPPSPDRPEEGGTGTAALAAWSEYLGALLRRAEELRKDFLALRDLDDLDPDDAEHRIDMTFAVALEFALNVERVTDAQNQSRLTRSEGTHPKVEEMQQLVLILRQSTELLHRSNSLVAVVKAVHALAEDMAIKQAVKDLLDDAGIPDWDTVQKDV